MGDLLGWVTLLSYSHVWLSACIFSSIWCALRAQKQGHAKAVHFSLGLLLGPGALPVVWMATQEELNKPMGLGLNVTNPGPEQSREFLGWTELYRSCQELKVAVILGVAGGLILNCAQAMSYFLPQIFAVNHSHVYSHSHSPALDPETLIRIVWILLALLGPSLGYFVAENWLRFKRLDRIWVLYAYQSAGARWRELVPSNLPQPADLTSEDPAILQQSFEKQLRDWSPRTIPLVLLLFFVLVIGFYTLGAVAYQDMLLHS